MRRTRSHALALECCHGENAHDVHVETMRVCAFTAIQPVGIKGCYAAMSENLRSEKLSGFRPAFLRSERTHEKRSMRPLPASTQRTDKPSLRNPRTNCCGHLRNGDEFSVWLWCRVIFKQFFISRSEMSGFPVAAFAVQPDSLLQFLLGRWNIPSERQWRSSLDCQRLLKL